MLDMLKNKLKNNFLTTKLSAAQQLYFKAVRRGVRILKALYYLPELQRKVDCIECNMVAGKVELLEKIHKYCPDEKRPVALADWFFENTGKPLHLDNPQTFNEKIQWLKLYDSTPLKTRLADKYLVRDWVKEKIGEEYLIPLIGVWDNFDEIDFDSLPDQFVLKCNHGSGYNIIVTDKSKLDIEDAEKKINQWMNEDFAFKNGFEMHYSPIERKIIAEKYIDFTLSDVEIQVYCYDGQIKYISYENCKSSVCHCRQIFDDNWQKLDFEISPSKYSPFEELPNIPSYFEELKLISKVLAKDFKHVRIDFIEENGKIKFREMTFTSGSGLSVFEPKSVSTLIGSYIRI